MMSVVQRRPLQMEDALWVLNAGQTCADCLRPQRVDYDADDAQWQKVVGTEVCMCIECYARRCAVASETPLLAWIAVPVAATTKLRLCAGGEAAS